MPRKRYRPRRRMKRRYRKRKYQLVRGLGVPNIYKFRLVLEAPLLTLDSTSVNQGFIRCAINVNSLSLHFNNQPNGASPPVPLKEEKDVANLFDQYRVQGITVTYTPHATDYIMDTDNSPSPPQIISDRNLPLYMAYDCDNAQTIPADELITRKGTKVRSLHKSFKVSWRIPKTYAPDQTSLSGGWRNLQKEVANLTGIIAMSTNQPFVSPNPSTGAYTPVGPSQEIGRVLIETYVLFRARQ